MDKFKLKQIIKKGENPKVDFKLRLSLRRESEKKELAKDIIAIANSRGGRGYLIFGIEDKTRNVIGIREDLYSEERIQQIIYNRCDPPVPVSLEFVNLDGKSIAIITIYKSNHKPHQMIQNGAFYIRRGSTTDVARRGELAAMLQQHGFFTFETVILKGSKIEDLDFNLIQTYFKNLNVFTEHPSEVLLDTMGFIGRETERGGYIPTIGGMLLFGKNPSLYLPHCNVKIIYKMNENSFYGNIIISLNEITEYLSKTLDYNKYPFDLLVELIANAIVHRDYMDTYKGIVVDIMDNKVIITNPGSLSSANRVYRYLYERNSKRRNSWLYQRLLIQDDKKRFLGTNMSLSKLKRKKYMYKEIKFIDVGSKNLFKVILKI
ncbi:MAG: RNA-binding domain-containing protein [Clostridiales bacterium]